jgi:hypothetical protein
MSLGSGCWAYNCSPEPSSSIKFWLTLPNKRFQSASEDLAGEAEHSSHLDAFFTTHGSVRVNNASAAYPSGCRGARESHETCHKYCCHQYTHSHVQSLVVNQLHSLQIRKRLFLRNGLSYKRMHLTSPLQGSNDCPQG